MKTRKILAAAAALCITTGTTIPAVYSGIPALPALTASAALDDEQVEIGDLTFRLTKSGAELIKCNTTVKGEVVIPAEAGGMSVRYIGYKAFYDCYKMTSVVIPDSVINIGDYAFEYCSSLTDISIPDSVTTIGSCAFSDTPWFNDRKSKELLIIAKDELVYASGLTGDIVVPDNITSIANCAFQGCTEITSVTLPDDLKKIGHDAFSGCSNLRSIELPGDLEYTGISPFSGSGLEKAVISDGMTFINSGLFEDCRELKSVTIPDSVERIEDDAFKNCEKLTDITLPAGLTYIGYTAFYCCSGLEELILPDSLSYIGKNAFEKCSSLKEISIPDNITDIMSGVFAGCTSLTTVKLPEELDIIPSGLFSGCTSLVSVNIPESVDEICESAFSGCSALSTITLPDYLQWIADEAFNGCTSLKSVTIPEYVYSIGRKAFADCTSLSDLVIDTEKISVRPYAFCNTAWFKEQCAANNVVVFDGTVAAGHICKGDVVIPEEAWAIDNSAFEGSIEMTSVHIPASVETIGANAFKDCDALTDVYYDGISSQWNLLKVSSEAAGNEQIFDNAELHFNTSVSIADDSYIRLWDNDIAYMLYNDHAVVIQNSNTLSGDIVIPEKVEGVPVTAVGDYAFLSHPARHRDLHRPECLPAVPQHDEHKYPGEGDLHRKPCICGMRFPCGARYPRRRDRIR